LDLESIFGDAPAIGPGGSDLVAVPVAPVDAPEADEADAPALGPSEAPCDHGDGLQPQGEPSADLPAADAPGTLEPGPDFSGWELRPDFGDRLGLEPADAAEPARWWAHGGFDDLPEPGDGCPQCGSLEAWLDLTGGRRCGECDGSKLGCALQLAHRAGGLRCNRPAVPQRARQPQSGSRLAGG